MENGKWKMEREKVTSTEKQSKVDQKEIKLRKVQAQMKEKIVNGCLFNGK